MQVVGFCLKASAYLLVLLLAGLWLKPHASFTHVPVLTQEELSLSDHSAQPLFTHQHAPTANDYQISKNDRGQYNIEFVTVVNHVSPRMLIWFLKHQASLTASFKGQEWQWFQLSHPVAHNRLAVTESASVSPQTLAFGTIIEVQEVIDSEKLRMSLQVRSIGDQGISFDVLHAGYSVGKLTYDFYDTPQGVKVVFNGELGLSWPLIGPISNFYLFKKVMPEDLLDAWVLHTLETYQHMEMLIPLLHRQKLHNMATPNAQGKYTLG